MFDVMNRILFLAFILPALMFAQQTYVDSLLVSLKTSSEDTNKLNILYALVENINDDNVWPKYNEEALKLSEKLAASKNKLISKKGKKAFADALNNVGFVYIKSDFGKALSYYVRSLKLREEIGDKKGIANSLNNIAFIFEKQGNIMKALDYYTRNSVIQNEIGDKKGYATSLNNIAVIFSQQGDVPKALDYYSKSLQIREEIGDKRDIATSLNNIGVIYSHQNDILKALNYYGRSLKIREETGDKSGIAGILNNIGAIYGGLGDAAKALDYYGKSLKIREEIGDKGGIAVAINNIGVIYFKDHDVANALTYYFKSLKIWEQTGDKKGIVTSHNNIASVYYLDGATEVSAVTRKQKYHLALSYSDSSLALAKQLGFPENIRNSERTFSKIDSALGNYAGAFEHYKQYVIYRDSISNEETRKASIKNQLKYEYEKKEAILKEQQEKERAISDEKNREQQIVIWSVGAGLLLVVIFAGFVFRSLKTTRHQKIIIEEKQKEILDSIRYAKRIQLSLLPGAAFMQKTFHRLRKRHHS